MAKVIRFLDPTNEDCLRIQKMAEESDGFLPDGNPDDAHTILKIQPEYGWMVIRNDRTGQTSELRFDEINLDDDCFIPKPKG